MSLLPEHPHCHCGGGCSLVPRVVVEVLGPPSLLRVPGQGDVQAPHVVSTDLKCQGWDGTHRHRTRQGSLRQPLRVGVCVPAIAGAWRVEGHSLPAMSGCGGAGVIQKLLSFLSWSCGGESRLWPRLSGVYAQWRFRLPAPPAPSLDHCVLLGPWDPGCSPPQNLLTLFTCEVQGPVFTEWKGRGKVRLLHPLCGGLSWVKV